MTNHNRQLSNLPTAVVSGNRFGIIQLSDLQFGRKHRFKDSTDFMSKLVIDIRNMSKDHNFRPLYILLSGDITETGHAEEFKHAAKVIGGICDELGIDRKKILCVPGNHDVNWNLSKLSEEAGDERLRFLPYNNFVSIITGSNEHLIKDRYVRLDDPTKSEMGEPNDSKLDDKNILGLEILLLNSCEKEDHQNHNGYVCKEKLLKTLQPQKDEVRLKIAILHHRLDTSIPDKRAAITNAAEIQSIIACHKYNIVLTGHVHKGLVHAYENHDGHKIIYAGCGSTGVYKGEREDGVPNQYCIHVIDFDESKFQSIWRAYYPLRQTKFGLGEWDEDTTLTKKTITDFSLPIGIQTMEPQAKTEEVSTRKYTLVSKTDREKMKLAFLNLLGGWKEND